MKNPTDEPVPLTCAVFLNLVLTLGKLCRFSSSLGYLCSTSRVLLADN